MGACFVIALAMGVVSRIAHLSLWWCIALALCVPVLIGIVKEIGDSREPGNRFDWGDIRDDVIGACAGTALVCLLWLL